MIYTSYFAKLKKLPDNIIPVSICGKAPDWYTGLQYKKLAPKYDFFMKWKENHDNDYYIRCFKEQVLGKIDLYNEVLPDLFNLVFATNPIFKRDIYIANCPPWDDSFVTRIALICYEKPGDFCHRHLVSDWFNENGIKCEEWSK